MRPSFPLIEQLAGPVTIEQVGRDGDSVRFRLTAPAPRLVSVAGLIPILTMPGHEVGRRSVPRRRSDSERPQNAPTKETA